MPDPGEYDSTDESFFDYDRRYLDEMKGRRWAYLRVALVSLTLLLCIVSGLALLLARLGLIST